MSTDYPRILTLSGTIPGEPGVGGVILNDLMTQLPSGTLQCIPAPSQQVVELGWLDRAPELAGHVVRRFETGWRPVRGIAGEIIGRAACIAKFNSHCRQITDQICRHPAAASCDIVWSILDCPTVIQVASDVASRLRKPMVALVWDAPELLVNSLTMDRWSGAAMQNRFAAIMRSADRVGVICEQMQQAYQKQFGGDKYVVLRHGIRDELWKNATHDLERLIIGFAGSITAAQPFRQLIAALDEHNWTVNGKHVTLRLIGSRYTLDSRKAQHIEFFGWRSLDETVRLLSECHLAYLPQPFENHLRPLAELSFPTKLTTYLAAGCPVLLHAPEYGSVVPFMTQHSIGVGCQSLATEEIAAALSQLDRQSRPDLSSAIDRTRRDEFSSDTFLQRFRQLIGVCDDISAAQPIEAMAESL